MAPGRRIGSLLPASTVLDGQAPASARLGARLRDDERHVVLGAAGLGRGRAAPAGESEPHAGSGQGDPRPERAAGGGLDRRHARSRRGARARSEPARQRPADVAAGPLVGRLEPSAHRPGSRSVASCTAHDADEARHRPGCPGSVGPEAGQLSALLDRCVHRCDDGRPDPPIRRTPPPTGRRLRRRGRRPATSRRPRPTGRRLRRRTRAQATRPTPPRRTRTQRPTGRPHRTSITRPRTGRARAMSHRPSLPMSPSSSSTRPPSSTRRAATTAAPPACTQSTRRCTSTRTSGTRPPPRGTRIRRSGRRAATRRKQRGGGQCCDRLGLARRRPARRRQRPESRGRVGSRLERVAERG